MQAKGRSRTPRRPTHDARARKGSRQSASIPEALTGTLALGALAWFAYNIASLYLMYPPWPDEALFADVSANLLRHGSMSTSLYSEFFPAMTRHYYLTPPLYHVLTAAWFAALGVGIGPMRFLSAAIAVGILGLAYALARALGLGRGTALLPVVFLALDGVFLHASLMGRMDLLALFFILLTLWLGLGALPDGKRGASRLPVRGRSFLLGIVSALAILTHPLGAIAAALSAGLSLAGSVSSAGRGREFSGSMAGDLPSSTVGPLRALLDGPLPLCAGLAVGLLPWALYALRDSHAFLEQVGGQLLRKSSREWWKPCISIAFGQWGVSRYLVLATWGAGLAGLALLAMKQLRSRALLVGQLVITAAVLTSCELWYSVYLTPLTYVGLACAISLFEGKQAWRRGVSLAVALLALLFVQQNMARISTMRSYRNLFERGDVGYFRWCEGIGRIIPPNSRVLLDCLPSPYFGLAAREDLRLQLFPPAGFKVSEAKYRPALERMDYIVGGRSIVNPEVRAFAASNGTLVAEVGSRQSAAYYAQIIHVNRGRHGVPSSEP